MEEAKGAKSSRDLGVCEQLGEAREIRSWRVPSKIQAESTPQALAGRDVNVFSDTGAYALPIIQALRGKPRPSFALVLCPSSELALKICDDFNALGSRIGLKCLALFGGVDMNEQAINLARRPHIVVATPGCLLDHLSNARLEMIKYLVLDEADRLLNMESEKVIDDILNVLPRDRRTFLFSATTTEKMENFRRACMKNPVKVEASAKYSTVDTCEQKFRLVPAKNKAAEESSGSKKRSKGGGKVMTKTVKFMLRAKRTQALSKKSKRLG